MGSSEPDPNVLALESIDAVHDADPAVLNEPVARLRQFVRIRRLLYYTVLAPFSALSRLSPLLVLATGVLAFIGTLIALLAGLHAGVTLLLGYVAIGGLLYHALSVRLASLMHGAAASVDLTASEVLARWNG